MKAVLLDFDGVLVDSTTLYLDLYREACRLWNHPLPIATVEDFRAWYNPRWEQNYYDMGFTEEEFQAVQEWALTALDYSRAALFPGVAEAVRSLAREHPLAIVSTTPSALIRARLAREGLEGEFRLVMGGDDGSSEKVEKIRQTLADLGATRGVMVGDTPLDVEAGRHHGLQTVAVTYGWCAHDRVHGSSPDRVIHHPGDLEPAVRELMARL